MAEDAEDCGDGVWVRAQNSDYVAARRVGADVVDAGEGLEHLLHVRHLHEDYAARTNEIVIVM